MWTATLDSSALTGRVQRRDVRRWARGLHLRPGVATRVRYIALPVLGAAAVLLGILAMLFGATQYLTSDDPDRYQQVIAMSGILALMVIAGLIMAVFFLRSRRQRLPDRTHYRLTRFAADNGWTYTPGPLRSPLLDRSLLPRGSMLVRSVVRMPAPVVEIGDFELITGGHGDRQTRFGGYCALRLPRALPNLLLRSRALGTHPMTADVPPDPDQRLKLEGDFDRHFTLFCPSGYEADALYLLTPDVMARLIDAAGGWDVEVRDDLLVLSRPRDAPRLDVEDWGRTVGAVRALEDKVNRWVRWREDRHAPSVERALLTRTAPPVAPPVAQAGRRLRTSRMRGFLSWVALPAGLLLVVVVSRFF